MKLPFLPLLFVLEIAPTVSLHAQIVEADVCVLGATSGGIAAAVKASRMGKRAVIADAGAFAGGLTTSGIGATDIGNKAAIGGIAREFYRRIARHYTNETAWQWETRSDYFTRRGSGQSKASDLESADATMWTFEPHVADLVFSNLLREAKVPVHFGQRLASVRKTGNRITEAVMENGNIFRARMFIDATYEGDLMAKADVSFHVGREGNREYGETLNGIRAETPKHQFVVPVDPYVKPGDATSGLLPFIQKGEPGKPGDGDASVQTYNFRLCFTTNAANRLPLNPPSHYDAAEFELLGRYLEAIVAAGRTPKLSEFWNPIWLPNQKTDINNNGGFSTDFIGANYEFPEGDFETRERITREHEDYTRGFLHFLATSPRVPEAMREEIRRWGPCKDEFRETAGWPRQLYVREGRRLIADSVMSERHCRGEQKAADAVGLAAYNMDSHNCRRIVKNGRVENEGDVQVAPMSPYPISYRALVPKVGECENLLVPVCLSASHIAYGSIRMEPVFMILGESAATAACLAIDDQVPVQQLQYSRLRARLLADNQVLDWKGPASHPASLPSRTLRGLVLDDADGVKKGTWEEGSLASASRVGTGYIHDGNGNKGMTSITWAPDLPEAGDYEIVLIAPPNSNRATNVPLEINIPSQPARMLKINQRSMAEGGFWKLGVFALPAGRSTRVTMSNRDTDGYVVADGVEFIRVK